MNMYLMYNESFLFVMRLTAQGFLPSDDESFCEHISDSMEGCIVDKLFERDCVCFVTWETKP